MPASTDPTDQSVGESFTIHVLNNYSDLSLWSISRYFNLTSSQVGALIRSAHRDLLGELEAVGVEYAALKNALVPKSGRHEVAFIIDSERAETGPYGYSMADSWLPIIRRLGPDKTAIRIGDIVDLPNELVWDQLQERMIGPTDFPRMHCSSYFVVYLTNLSTSQLSNLDRGLAAAIDAYLGYIDCSTWIPIKAGLLLPQVGLRIGNSVVTGADEEGNANSYGYPFEEAGFDVVGIPDELYGPFLGHRLDNGVPARADQDSSMSLTVIGGDLKPASNTSIVITESRIEYLGKDHEASLSRAGLADLGKDRLADAIQERLYNGLIYNLRFIDGRRNNVSAPEFNALMYSVQVEFPDEAGTMRRYQVGLKYTPESHTSEVVTLF